MTNDQALNRLRQHCCRELGVKKIPDDLFEVAEHLGGYVTEALSNPQERPTLVKAIRKLRGLRGRGHRQKYKGSWSDSWWPKEQSMYSRRLNDVLQNALFASEDRGYVVMQVHPRVPASDVACAYRRWQNLLLKQYVVMPGQGKGPRKDGQWCTISAGRNRRLSEKTLARYEWVTDRRRQHPHETWQATMSAWNRAFPQWAHRSGLSNFIRDCRRGERYLTPDPLEDDSDP